MEKSHSQSFLWLAATLGCLALFSCAEPARVVDAGAEPSDVPIVWSDVFADTSDASAPQLVSELSGAELDSFCDWYASRVPDPSCRGVFPVTRADLEDACRSDVTSGKYNECMLSVDDLRVCLDLVLPRLCRFDGYHPPECEVTDACQLPMDEVVSNSCSAIGGDIFADPGLESHRLAVRLTPPEYPFEITSLKYRVTDYQICEKLPHELRLYVGSGEVPDASPVFLYNARITPTRSVGAEEVELEIPPVVVESGQHLFVELEMPIDNESPLCVQVCEAESMEPARQFWSNAVERPYSWVDLGTFDWTTANVFMEAQGRRAESE